VIAILLGAAALHTSHAFGAVTFTSSDLSGRAASATFSISGSILTVQLTNTSTHDALDATDILTGVFFNITNTGPLTPLTADLAAGSHAYDIPSGALAEPDTSGKTGVGGEYAYGSGLAYTHAATEGISSSGLGLFGNGNFTASDPNGDLGGPSGGAIDGVQYGITSAGDNLSTGNGSLTSTNNHFLIQNSVVFTLSGVFPGNAGVTDVWFQYGTALNEPSIQGTPGGGTPRGSPGEVPEPATLAIWGLGLGVAGLVRLARRTK